MQEQLSDQNRWPRAAYCLVCMSCTMSNNIGKMTTTNRARDAVNNKIGRNLQPAHKRVIPL